MRGKETSRGGPEKEFGGGLMGLFGWFHRDDDDDVYFDEGESDDDVYFDEGEDDDDDDDGYFDDDESDDDRPSFSDALLMKATGALQSFALSHTPVDDDQDDDDGDDDDDFYYGDDDSDDDDDTGFSNTYTVSNSGESEDSYSGSSGGCLGCLLSSVKIAGFILLLILAIPLFLVLLFMLITGGDFWGFIGSIFGFIWQMIVFVFSGIGQFFVWLFHLIF